MVVFKYNETREAVDFLFVSESKPREFENICLIGGELERRGYKVGVVNFWETAEHDDFEPIDAKVLFAHAVYKDESLNKELAFVTNPVRVINMQCEQVYTVKDLINPKSPWRMMGRTHEIDHVSWGNANYKKLVDEDKVPAELVHIVGNTTLDTLREPIRQMYKTRDELCDEFDIDKSKKICLFISSFSFVNLPQSIIDSELIDFYQVSIDSQKEVMSWFDRILKEREDITVIYRPHPAEKDNKDLYKLSDKYQNFKIINKYSVKQWVLASDIVYNWYSTSMAEIYYSGKTCYLIRPNKIPDDYECTVFLNGDFISEYDEFAKTFNDDNPKWPTPIENITDNYFVDENEYTFEKIANLAEEIIKKASENTQVYVPSEDDIQRRKKAEFKKTGLGKLLLFIKKLIDSVRKETEQDQKNKHYKEYVHEMYMKNSISEDELNEMCSKISALLN